MLVISVISYYLSVTQTKSKVIKLKSSFFIPLKPLKIEAIDMMYLS